MILLAHIRGRAIRHIVIAVAVGVALLAVAARGETPPAFGRRCIPADCVAPPSNIPDILSRRALSAGRLAALGATADFHHGLLAALRSQPAGAQAAQPAASAPAFEVASIKPNNSGDGRV